MMCGWALGFMIGIGAFHGPWRWMLGHDQTHEDETFLAGKDQGIGRYFRFTTDHKVVGIQYLVVTMMLFGIGGTLAMMIRTDLITPDSRFLGPQTYNAVVGLHGLSMILATIIMVTGPFGNFIVPIMIGARDMAFPRLNALSLWLLVAMLPVFVSAAFLGGIPTGWSGYAPLSDQAGPGMDAYLMAIIIFAISSRDRRREHHDDDPHDARARHDLEPHADLRLGRAGQRRPGRPGVPDVHGVDGAARRRPHGRRATSTSRPAAAARGCTPTCSG